MSREPQLHQSVRYREGDGRIILKPILLLGKDVSEDVEMNGTRSCAMARLGIRGDEPPGYATKKLLVMNYLNNEKITRLEMCTLSSTLKFEKHISRHITGVDISRTTKEITNATMASKATVVSKVIVATM
jgi:hypothetical protein